MVLLCSSLFCDTPSRRQVSKRLIGVIFFASVFVALGSCYLTFLYVSNTTIFFAKFNSALQALNYKSPLDGPIIFHPSNRRFPFLNYSEYFLGHLPNRIGLISHRGSDGSVVGRDWVEDWGSGFSSKYVSDSGYELKTNASTNGRALSRVEDADYESSSSSEGGSHLNDDLHNVFHDKDIFHKSYQEMNQSLKIYVYHHKLGIPFQNGQFLSINEANYASVACFNNILMKSHFITKDPSEADLFFLSSPTAQLQRNGRMISVGGGLADFTQGYIAAVVHQFPYWNRTGGADHFYVACRSSALLSQAPDLVQSNAIQVVCSSSYVLPSYFPHKDVSLPQVWMGHQKPDNIDSPERETLAFFAGAVNCPACRDLHYVWKEDPDIIIHNTTLSNPYITQLLRSKFCIHVGGFEVNTASLGDIMYHGCVPVIIADQFDLPFTDILNWKKFAVVIQVSDIAKLKNILQGIVNSEDEYAVLRKNVAKVTKHFQWNHFPSDYDAFYMVMFELWLRRSSIRLFV